MVERRLRGMGWRLRVGALCLLGVGCAAAGALAQGPIDLTVERSSRRVELNWGAAPEVDDPLFGGYRVWRATAPEPPYLLLREFARRYPVGWTFCGGNFPNCGPVNGATRRAFVDPDSLADYIKILPSMGEDSVIVRRYLTAAPHNGFSYYYAVTWLNECLTDRNDTLKVNQPQPEIFSYMRGGEERFAFLSDAGDTLQVQAVECERLDPVTNAASGEMVTVYRGIPDVSERALIHYAITESRIDEPVFPSARVGSTLQNVRVIPNPYDVATDWDTPGSHRMQFVNLTERATIRIFTVAGDLVRRLEHPATGSPPGQGALNWDLTNGDGRLVEAGIYIWHVESPDHTVDREGRLVIIR